MLAEIFDELSPMIPVRISLSRVRLNGGGYDSRGRYWGQGAPLFSYAGEIVLPREDPRWERFFPDDLDINGHVRARDRDEAKKKILAEYPSARFAR